MLQSTVVDKSKFCFNAYSFEIYERMFQMTHC